MARDYTRRRDDRITVKVDGRTMEVRRGDYVTAKTKQLKEFGYSTLTEPEVSSQLGKILQGDQNLTVIGKFIVDEIVVVPKEALA